VARNGGPQGESLRPLPRSGDPQLSQIVIDQLQMSIKKILLDESIPRDDMSARSATEIQQRIQELAQNLGSAFGRLITEVMTPIVQRTLQIMDAQNLIELPLKVNGLEVKIKPVSPIAQSQNNQDINNVIQFAQIVSQLGPEGQTILKIGKMADYIAEKLGIPANLTNSEEERAMIVQQTQELIQQQAEAEMMQQQADAQPPEEPIQ
jgi:antitoxin component of RelBE/YafQ-DinJ toxin-antitoxin module